MAYEQLGRHGNYDGHTLSSDTQFLIDYVQEAGLQAWTLREVARAADKVDLTVITTADLVNSRIFKRDVRRRYGPDVPVHDEEGEAVRPGDLEVLFVNDPLDGSGEYGAKYRDPITGKPIKPGAPVPPNAIEIEDKERTSCVGTARFERGIMTAAAVYDPYQDELFVADRRLGAAYLNGHRLDLSRSPGTQQEFGPDISYDFASWRGSLIDPRHLRRDLGKGPNNTYSAIKQGCDVAAGRSDVSIFTGTTLHDFIAALIAELANATVSDIHGNPIDWNNPQGLVCSANPTLHAGAIAAINAPRIDGLPPGYRPVGRLDVNPEEVLHLRQHATFGTEQRLHVWRDALAGSHAFVGARDRRGELVLASFLTGTSRHGTLHDLTVHPDHRWQGLASYSIDKRLMLAEGYEAGGQRVGMAYIEVDLGANDLGTIPLGEYYQSLGFVANTGVLIRDYRHSSRA